MENNLKELKIFRRSLAELKYHIETSIEEELVIKKLLDKLHVRVQLIEQEAKQLSAEKLAVEEAQDQRVKAKKKVKIQKKKKRKVAYFPQGSVMTGLTNVTSSRNWNVTK